MYYAKQIERHAIVAWVVYGIKLTVPLSAAARRELGRIRRSAAGLAEVAHERTMRRGMYETNGDFVERVLRERTMVRAYTVAREASAAALVEGRARHGG